MSTSNSGLSVAQQMLQEGSLPDMPESSGPWQPPMRAVVSAASTMNPDAEAKVQQLSQQSGMGADLVRHNPETARQLALAAELDRRDLEITNPILARQLQNVNFAGMAHDDLDSLSSIEQGAAALRPTGGAGVGAYFAGNPAAMTEAKSLGGNVNAGMFAPVKSFVDAGGALAQGVLDSPKPMMDFLTGLDPDADELKNVWVRPRSWAVQRATDPAMAWATAGVQPGPAAQVIDPNTQQPVANPAYRWWGRPLVNSLEQVPGALAGFMATGNVAGAAGEAANADTAAAEGVFGAKAPGAALESQAVPALLGTQAAQTTYAQARAKGADQKTAVLAALASGMTNYALMGKMPGAAPTDTVAGAIGQWAGRSAAMGTTMTVADNAIARSYDPDRSLLEGLPQSVATMAAFEGVGGFHDTLGHITDAVEASKLRERSPQAFQQAMDANFEGDASLRIPAQDFVNYFAGKKLDPAAAANELEVTNLEEAATAGSDVEIPRSNFFGKLDPEHQRGLLPDVVDPSTDLTAKQAQGSREELQQWMSGGGIEQLQAEYAQADAETQATPEWQRVYSDLKQRYADAGEPEAAADSYATMHANAYANLARKAGLRPDELLAMHNPDLMAGDAPGAVLHQDAMSGEPVEGEDGKETSLLTPTRQIPAQYRLVEADSLQPSHNAQTFEKNPAYPDGLQERAYDTSKEAQNRVIEQAQNYDPRYTINSNPDAVNGPPVITPDGTVLGGNSRAMSTQRLYAKNGDAYKNALKEQAAAYGFTSEQVDGMEKPVLVRQVGFQSSPDEGRRLGAELNKSMTGALGVSERAVSAGRNIKPETIRRVADMMQADDSTLREAMERHGGEIVKMLVGDGAITERERPQFVDTSSGGLSDEGKAFVERALMGSIIDDPRLMDSAPKSVLSKLERSLGSITSFASRPDEWNLLPAIREAVSELGSIQREGSTVALRLGQTSLFGGERNPLVDAMVRALDGKPNEVRKAFDAFARDADENLPGQARMFGEANAFDAFNHAFGSKLTEQEYHDGLKQSGTAIPKYAGTAHSRDDVGLPERAGGDETPGSESGRPEVGAGELRPDAAQGVETAPKSATRGWFRMRADGSYELGKTKIGDLSTFIHEPAHAYLEIYRKLTQREGASEPLKDDFRKVTEWLGTTPEEAYKNGFTREQHEQWARANEQYVREGKAPSSGLTRAFHNFSVWLSSIYRRAEWLGVELSPEIRGVMKRLYAGEDAVSRAGQETGEPLFKSADEAGWTDAEFKNYAESKGISEAKAREQVAAELNDAALRERAEKWREEKSNVREAVTAEIDARPEYRAIRSLRKGILDDGAGDESPLTLNRDALVSQFGEDRARDLNKLHRGVYRNEGGTDAETAAELLGYDSGEEMMRAMESAPRRSVAIDAATRDYMTAKHGDVRYDGSLDGKARLAVENDERAKSLHREVTALRQKVADLQKSAADSKAAMRAIVTAPLAHYQEAARRMIDDKAIADLQPNRYLTASRMFSREAFDALRKGDAKAAAEAKNKELLNHFLFREASAASDYADKFESYAKRVQSVGIQQRMGLAQESSGIDYRDQFNWLMARYKLAQAPQPQRPLRDWADEVYDQGKEPAIPPGILNGVKFADYRNVPLSEVRDLHDALVNIRTLAQAEFKQYVQGKMVNFQSAKVAMMQSARENLRTRTEKVFDENRTLAEQAADMVAKGDAMLMRQERIFEWLDGGKTGPWHDNIWNLAADAQGDEYALQELVTKPVFDKLKELPESVSRSLFEDKLEVEGVGEPMTRKRLVSVAMNMGNEGNLDRLRKTFMYFGWDPDAVQRIGGMLTREEWEFVQKTWDSLKPIGARGSELERRMTGLAPVMVDPQPFKVNLADGTEIDLPGGYYPIDYDRRYTLKGYEEQAGKQAQNVMQAGYGRAATSRTYLKGRTGSAGPLRLDFEQTLTDHLAKAAKDISHREFMLSSQRFLLDTEIRKTLRETLGPAYEQQFMPWLRTIINDRNGSAGQGLEYVSDAMQKLRSNIVVASTGFKVSTGLLQLSHAPRMMLYAKPGSLTQSLVDFLRDPVGMTRGNQELSPNELRFRGDSLDRDLRAALQGPANREGLTRKAAVAARWTLQMADHLFSHTLWRAAYRDALANYPDLPVSEASAKAVHEADSAVRLGLGSGAPKDLPAVMRKNDMLKLFTTLYGFHNGVYNQLRDIGHEFGKMKYAGAQSLDADGSVRGTTYTGRAAPLGGRVGKLTYAAILTAVVPALLGSMLTGDRPKDDENLGLWAAKRSLLFSADTIPELANISGTLLKGTDFKLTPLESALNKAGMAAHAAITDKGEKDWTGISLNAAESAGGLLGVPGSQQAVKTLRYVKRANEGKVDNPNWWDAMAGGGYR